VTDDFDWMASAACHGMGAEWHRLHWSSQLKKCRSCSVKPECWDLCTSSFETWSSDGTWAGTNVNERLALGNWERIMYNPPRMPDAA
jgi:hypothetical protein